MPVLTRFKLAFPNTSLLDATDAPAIASLSPSLSPPPNMARQINPSEKLSPRTTTHQTFTEPPPSPIPIPLPPPIAPISPSTPASILSATEASTLVSRTESKRSSAMSARFQPVLDVASLSDTARRNLAARIPDISDTISVPKSICNTIDALIDGVGSDAFSRAAGISRKQLDGIQCECAELNDPSETRVSTSTSPTPSLTSGFNGKSQKKFSGLKKTHIRLANTAVGLREIAKKIGKRTLQWESPPKNLLIVTKIHDPDLVQFTKDLAVWLINECGMTVLVEERLREYPEFAAFHDIEEYNVITEYGLSPENGANGGFDENVQRKSTTMQLPDTTQKQLPTNTTSNTLNNLHFWSPEDFQTPLKTDPLSSKIDLIVTLGGDGTVLFTAGLFQNVKVPPILPFDLGSLGFLAVFEFERAKETLRKVLGILDVEEVVEERVSSSSSELGVPLGLTVPKESHDQLRSTTASTTNLTGFNVNMRLRLACQIYRMDPSTGNLEPFEAPHHVLNELVVDRGPSAYMSHLELFVDGSYLTTSMADGLVIATPTGSTAYSLSAGGSIVHPLVPALLVTPICPHTLSFRPMLLPESIELKVQVPRDARGTAWVSFDGKLRRELRQGDEVRVEVSRFGVPTVCWLDQSKDWIESLRRCLHWNVRARQKEFK
ncbi:NAD(+) kinase [Rhizoclosmatium hyalinum]|nr:NAD(+) kinase [Rhizoclosmatium hyalinum]